MAIGVLAQRSRSDLRVLCAKVAIATGVATPVLLASLRFLSPGFDPSFRMMSEYALGQYQWVLTLTFLSWGISSWTLALAIGSQVTGRAGRIGLALLVVAGCGEALAAVFDIRMEPAHDLVGFPAICGLPVAAMLISRNLGSKPAWSSARRRLLVFANLTWISLILFGASFVVMTAMFLHVYGGRLPSQAPATLPHGVIGLVGWANRLFVLLYCAWAVVVAATALRCSANRAER